MPAKYELTVAKRIFQAVFKDLHDRGGFDHWWDNIDSDIQSEIKTELIAKIEQAMKTDPAIHDGVTLTKRQQVLRAKHGTPDEFAVATNRAADQLVITTAESDAAIAKYRQEWQDAAYADAPVTELKDALPVVLYFGTEADRAEFLEMVKAAKPGMVARAV